MEEQQQQPQQDDEVWDVKKLATFLGYKEETVRAYSTSKPDRLPPRIAGVRRPRWLKAAVLEWAAERSGMPNLHTHRPPEEVAPMPPPDAPQVPRVPDVTVLKVRRGRPRRPPP
ncbi:MAG: hypothetical protein ACREYA_32365 [Cupriavidus necator]